MRIAKMLILVVSLIAVFFHLPGRIEDWSAARVDHQTALERIAFLGTSGKNHLDLSDLKHLTYLPLELATLSELKRINLSGNNVTDIELLAGLKNLEHLSMNDVPVMDISVLSNLSALVDLSISRTWIFDLHPISKLSRLEQLNLSYTALKSLEPLIHLRKIEQITLYKSYAHDGSQKYFKSLKRNIPRVNNGSAFRQNYQPDWMYRTRIWLKRLKHTWMIDRPKIS